MTLLKFVKEERSSVCAFIRLAFAPAKEDSDCAKSVNVISPFVIVHYLTLLVFQKGLRLKY